MNTPWHYAENQFLNHTKENFRLMNIIVQDHLARCTDALDANPGNATLTTVQTRAAAMVALWNPLYLSWKMSNGLWNGCTLAVEQNEALLAQTKIRQWDAAVQGVHLEGTPEYKQIFPQGRKPFQSGGRDARIAAVGTLAETLENEFLPVLDTLHAAVVDFFGVLTTTRADQQAKEHQVEAKSTALEAARQTVARRMYGSLGLVMSLSEENPAAIEDFWDMNYLREGAEPPPEVEVPAKAVVEAFEQTGSNNGTITVSATGATSFTFLLRAAGETDYTTLADNQPSGTYDWVVPGPGNWEFAAYGTNEAGDGETSDPYPHSV